MLGRFAVRMTMVIGVAAGFTVTAAAPTWAVAPAVVSEVFAAAPAAVSEVSLVGQACAAAEFSPILGIASQRDPMLNPCAQVDMTQIRDCSSSGTCYTWCVNLHNPTYWWFCQYDQAWHLRTNYIRYMIGGEIPINCGG